MLQHGDPMVDAPADPELVTRYYARRVPWGLAIPIGISMLAFSPWNFSRWLQSLICGSGSVWGYVLIFPVVLFPTAVWAAIVVTWERRLMRQLRCADYRLCPRCGYSLVGLRGTIACPECGRPCKMTDVQRAWRLFRPRLSGVFSRS